MATPRVSARSSFTRAASEARQHLRSANSMASENLREAVGPTVAKRAQSKPQCAENVRAAQAKYRIAMIDAKSDYAIAMASARLDFLARTQVAPDRIAAARFALEMCQLTASHERELLVAREDLRTASVPVHAQLRIELAAAQTPRDRERAHKKVRESLQDAVVSFRRQVIEVSRRQQVRLQMAKESFQAAMFASVSSATSYA